MIKICKIKDLVFNKDDYYIFSGWCGEHLTLIYRGDNPPKLLKTVYYKVTGEMVKHEKHGNQFVISEYEKAGNVKIHRSKKEYYQNSDKHNQHYTKMLYPIN